MGNQKLKLLKMMKNLVIVNAIELILDSAIWKKQYTYNIVILNPKRIEIQFHNSLGGLVLFRKLIRTLPTLFIGLDPSKKIIEIFL